ncbi:hypothetical protein BX600DRAFT_499645 [Xylariales sp. PMI_506]|nr:hypothetical protein BX600DRAFT_499645 [Xylariales sp. PMI_506]
MSSVLDLLGKYNNLHDPTPVLNTREAVFGLVIPFLILSWACGATRLYTRFCILKCPGWDDFFVVLVMITTLILSVGTCLTMDHGLGQHFILLNITGMAKFIKSFYIPNSMYPMSTCFIKLALLIQYRRILQSTSNLHRITLVVIVITALWGFAYSFIAWVPCWPVSAYWDWSSEAVARWGFGSHDPNVFVATYISHVASNLVLDIVVFAIPIPLYLNPELTHKSKLGLCGLFVLGLIVNMFGIWRLVAIIDTRAGTSPTLDPSWYGCGPIVLAALEIDLALICASLPVFWPAIEKTLSQIFVTREVEVVSEIDAQSDLNNDEAELYKLTSFPVSSAELPPPRKQAGKPPRWLIFPLDNEPTPVVTTIGREVENLTPIEDRPDSRIHHFHRDNFRMV